MKNTIRTKKIGKYEIIEKFDILPIDPEETRSAVEKPVSELPEYIKVKEKATGKNAFNVKTRAALLAGRGAAAFIKNANAVLETVQDPVARVKIQADIKKAQDSLEKETKNYEAFLTQAKSAEIELGELNTVFAQARKNFIRKNPVYSECRLNETVLPDSEIEELRGKLNNLENAKLLVDGSEVEDFRGKQYFFNDGEKWVESEIITELGVTKNTVVVDEYQDQACTFEELEPEYQDEWRIQNLTVEQKEIEKNQSIQSALSQSAQMKAELEILEDNEALSKSQAFYQSEKERIELKYG